MGKLNKLFRCKMITKEFILEQCRTAISEDVLSANEGKYGLVQLLHSKGPKFAADIPAAFEYFSLLEHVITTCNPIEIVLTESSRKFSVNGLSTGVYVTEAQKQLLLAIQVEAGMLSYVAHWITETIPSEKIKALPGTLVIPFALEDHGNASFLLPEWCAAFYVDGEDEKCIPVITLRSVLHTESIPPDWTLSALYRLHSYDLDVDKAIKAAGGDAP